VAFRRGDPVGGASQSIFRRRSWEGMESRLYLGNDDHPGEKRKGAVWGRLSGTFLGTKRGEMMAVEGSSSSGGGGWKRKGRHLTCRRCSGRAGNGGINKGDWEKGWPRKRDFILGLPGGRVPSSRDLGKRGEQIPWVWKMRRGGYLRAPGRWGGGGSSPEDGKLNQSTCLMHLNGGVGKGKGSDRGVDQGQNSLSTPCPASQGLSQGDRGWHWTHL